LYRRGRWRSNWLRGWCWRRRCRRWRRLWLHFFEWRGRDCGRCRRWRHHRRRKCRRRRHHRRRKCRNSSAASLPRASWCRRRWWRQRSSRTG
jgi:hypothetical protein